MAKQHKLDIPMLKNTPHMFNDIVIPKSPPPKSNDTAKTSNKENDLLPLVLRSPGITRDESLQYLATSRSNMSFRSNVSGGYSGSLINRQALLAGMATESAYRLHEERRHCRTIFITTVLSVSACALVLIFILDIFGLSHQEPLIVAGLIGLWPTFGGNAMNQQRPPLDTPIYIHTDNIDNVTTLCHYISDGGIGFNGYITIDDESIGYVSDGSGYIISVYLDSCTEQWKTNIGILLGYNESINVISFQTLTLFQDSVGNQGLIFGASCFAVAVHLINGTLWWKVQLSDMECITHGFTVDGAFAYGGIGSYHNPLFIGRYFKIDIDEHEIVDEWYPFHYDLNASDDIYSGISMYGFPAIIDDYLIFATSSLWRIPSNIDECLSSVNTTDFNEFLLLSNSNYMDICGNDKSNNTYFRCLEKDIYPSSLIVLDKHTMELKEGFVLQGLDIAFNADLSAVAALKDEKGMIYVAGSQNSQRFHVFDVDDGSLIVSRTYGAQSVNGEFNHFNMAVDESAMIGITSINGGRYTLSNGIILCETGSIQAFDLRNGDILYEIVNPFGYINDSYCFNDIDYTERTDTNCESGEFEDASNVIIPPISNESFIPMDARKRALFSAPVTIANDMVIIPSDTGDIWIHDLYDGSFIHHFACPDTQLDDGTWNRAGIKGGVSVVNDRIVFYCGGYGILDSVKGNILVSMKLN